MIMILICIGFLSRGDIGTTMYPLVKVAAGPRAVALGEAFVGLCDDISANYWNPAGLSKLKGLQFFISHHEWFMDIRDEYLTIGMPGLGGYFTLAGIYSSLQDVEIWDEYNMPDGIQSVWSGILCISHGRKLNDRLALGLGIKALHEDLYEQSFQDFAVDIGSQLFITERISLGGSLRNIGYKIELPSDFKIGLCYRDMYKFNLLLDITAPSDNIPHASAGIEYNLNEYLSIRSGWRSGPYDMNNLGWLSGLTTGIGLHFAHLNLDYAFVPYGKLGITHRIALHGGLRFIEGANSLQINLLDGDSKDPLEGSLTLSGVKQGIFSTNKAGKVEFKNMPEGWIFINTFVPLYPENFDSVFVHAQGRTDKNIFLYKILPGLFRGIVFDAATKKPIAAEAVYKGPAYGRIDNDTITGSFVLKNLPPGIFTFEIAGKDTKYIPQSCTITIERAKLREKEFYLVKIREKIILRGVNFETGKADLKPESYLTLDEAGQILIDNPDIHAELAGHTDPREINTTDYPSNWELSLARAEIVRQYLIDKFNIDPVRLTARGYADTQPVAPNATEEGMAQNRRTEFRILE